MSAFFVSYFDYYQPVYFIDDTYIERFQINEEIEKLRHAATSALLTRRDHDYRRRCIYIGSPVLCRISPASEARSNSA